VKVFISWSGEPSRSIAKALNDWLEGVLPQVEPWVSDEEIRSGARWGDVLAKSLEDTDYGVICVTRENQTSPWLIFEAGALSKKVETAKIVPLCIDLPPSDVFKGPLTPFQGLALDEAGIRRLVHDLNQDTEKPMSKERLNKIFDRAWPDLESAIAEAIETGPVPPKPQRKTDDMLAEVIDAVRRIERVMGRWVLVPISPDMMPDLGISEESASRWPGLSGAPVLDRDYGKMRWMAVNPLQSDVPDDSPTSDDSGESDD